jgi:stage IV sporulation protein FB
MNFRFLNIPVHIHPSFWIFFLFFTNLYRELSVDGLILGGVLIFSLLVHEFGHALTAQHFGAQPSITLEAFGGRAHYSNARMSATQDFFITLNGPLFESLLIFLPYFLLKMGAFDAHPYMRYFLYATMRLNLMWCLFNLIPICPLDGGYLLRNLLERKWGDKGTRISFFIGLSSAFLAVPLLFFLGYSFFAVLLLVFGLQHLRFFRKAAPTAFQSYLASQEAIKAQDFSRAKTLLKRLLKSQDSLVQQKAVEALAKLYIEEHETQKAYDLLLTADPKTLKEGKCLLCKLAFARKNYQLVGNHAREIYAIEPTFEIALLNSQAYAALNEPAPAGAWLHTASQFGSYTINILKEQVEKEVYAPVREHEAFKKYRDKIFLQESGIQ